MNQYEKENAMRYIEGYYLHQAWESDEKTFERAKKETIDEFKKILKNCSEVSFEDFMKWKGIK